MTSHRLITALTILACSCSLLNGQEYYVHGSGDVFIVTPEALAKTPRWDPLAEEAPVFASDAIRAAANYHNKIIPTGRTTFHVWQLAGATLVHDGEDRWYWVVQYRGFFDPKFPPREDGKLGGGYTYKGKKTQYNRYPVLFNGRLAPARVKNPPMPTAIRAVEE